MKSFENKPRVGEYTASGRPSERVARIPGGQRERAPGTEARSTTFVFFLLIVYILLVHLRLYEYAALSETFKGIPLLPGLIISMLIAWAITLPRNFDAAQLPLSIGLLVWVPLTLALTGWISGTIEEFANFTPIIILFLIAATTIDTLPRLRVTFFALGAAMTFIALHGIDQKENEIGWSGAMMIQDRITYVGILNDPNDLALALLVAVPMVMSFVRRKGSKLVAVAALCSTTTMLYAIYLTNSRGAIIALGAMILVLSFKKYGMTKGLLLTPVLLLALIVAAPDRASEISADEASASGRIEAWYSGFQMLKSRPISGVGKGQFTEHHIRTAHNSYVLTFAELGIIGYFLWFSMIAVSARMLLTIIRDHTSTRDPPHTDDVWAEHRRLALILLCSLTAFSTAAFFLSRSYIITLYLILAMVVGLYQSARLRRPDLPPMRLKELWGWLVKLSIGSIISMWVATRILLAYN